MKHRALPLPLFGLAFVFWVVAQMAFPAAGTAGEANDLQRLDREAVALKREALAIRRALTRAGGLGTRWPADVVTAEPPAGAPSPGETMRRIARARYPDLLAGPGAIADVRLRAALLAVYGLHSEAGAAIDAAGLPPAERARARLSLGRMMYRHGYLEEARAALVRADETLPAALQAERRLLEGQILLAQGRYDQASEVLVLVPAMSGQAGFARYNLAVALWQAGHRDEGLQVLEALAREEGDGAEDRALRDRINVVLGFHHLDSGRPLAAKAAFERVRVNGPFSAQALLGLGWSEWQLQRWKRALVPWNQLRESGGADPAVAEALVMVPEALVELQSHARAAERYRQADRILQAELARIAALIEHYGRGLPETLADGARWDGAEAAWFWEDPTLSGTAPELVSLLAGDAFQTAYGDYRDLRTLHRLLADWAAAAPEAMRSRIQGLRERVARLQVRLERHLRDRVLGRLGERRAVLQDYLLRVRHGRARLLDVLVHRDGERP